jgi:hypothetical protein
MTLRQAALQIDAARNAQECTFSPFLKASSTRRESRHKRGSASDATNGAGTNGTATDGAATDGVGGASASPPPRDGDAALSDDGDADGDGGASSPSHAKGMPLKRTLYQQASDM